MGDMDQGFLGNLFDINRDGKIDAVERALEYEFMMKEMEKTSGEDEDDSVSFLDVDPEDEELMQKLQEKGIDPEDFDALSELDLLDELDDLDDLDDLDGFGDLDEPDDLDDFED